MLTLGELRPRSVSPIRILAWVGAAVAGLAGAFVVALAVVSGRGFGYRIDPRSEEGIVFTLFAAGIALVVGAVATLLPRPLSRIALGALAGPLAGLGLFAVVVNRGAFESFVLAFVVPPSAILGALLARRFWGRPRTGERG